MPIDITKDIQPMNAFRNRSAEFLEHLRTSKRPLRFCQLSRQLGPGLVAGSATGRPQVG